MEVLRLSRTHLRFPSRCVGCQKADAPKGIWLPLKRWRRASRVEVPVCGVCLLRLRLTRPLFLSLMAVACAAIVVDDGISLGGLSVWWWIGAGFLVASAIGRIHPASWRVLNATTAEVELGFDDPALLAEVVASSTATPYRGSMAVSLTRKHGRVEGLIRRVRDRYKSSRWYAIANRRLW